MPAVAAFVQAAKDALVLVSRRRAHINAINKAERNLGWERNLAALRTLAAGLHGLPELYKQCGQAAAMRWRTYG